MRLPALLTTALLVLAANAQAQDVGETQTFGDWMVGCDNRLACTAVGLGAEDASEPAYVVVRRAAGAESQASLSAAILTGEAEPAELALNVEGAELPVSVLGNVDTNWSLSKGHVEGADAVALIEALLPESRLSLSAGAVEGEVSLAGMSAALRYMDDRQGRAGSVSALVARGQDAAEGASPAPEPVRLEALPLREVETPGERPDGLTEADEYCPEGLSDLVFEAEGGVRLWGTCVSAGAYNLFYDFARVDADGSVTALDLGRFGQGFGESGGATLVNPALSENGLTVEALARARGIGDCGSFVALAFDGESLRPAEFAVMGECRGVSVDDWPVLYRAEVSSR